MARYKFKTPEKHAIFKILGPNCIWCKEPVAYKDCEIDHIIPESLNQNDVSDLIVRYNLPKDFSVNSFYNWAPIHSRCNRGKSSKTFRGAPFIAEILQVISGRSQEIKKIHDNFIKQSKNIKILAHLENALENNQLAESDIEYLITKNRKSLNGKYNDNYIIAYKGSYGDRSPKQLYDIECLQFSEKSESYTELNILLKAEAIKELIQVRGYYTDFLEKYEIDDNYEYGDSTYDYGMSLSHISQNFISFTNYTRVYEIETAHDQYGIKGCNYYLHPLKKFSLKNLIIDYRSFIAIIAPLTCEKIIYAIKLMEPDIEVSDEFPIEQSWLMQNDEAFTNYFFSQTSLTFIFNPYEISAWSYGAHFPEFTFNELFELFPHEEQLIALLKSF